MKYLEPKELALKLREGEETILIVDVRDSDYEVIIRLFCFIYSNSSIIIFVDSKDKGKR